MANEHVSTGEGAETAALDIGFALHTSEVHTLPNGRSARIAKALFNGLRGEAALRGDDEGLLFVDPTRASEIIKVYEDFGVIEREDPPFDVRVNDLGTLAVNTSEWPGKVSLRRRLLNGDLSQQELEAARALLPRMFVPASEDAPMRCSDPRILKGFDCFNLDHLFRPLGPQTIAGTLGLGITMRLGEGASDWSKVRLEDDALDATSTDSRTGQKPGDHLHDKAGHGDMGCKGVDAAVTNLENLTSPELLADIDAHTRHILGPNGYHERSMSNLRGNALAMRAHFPDYFAGKARAVENLKDHGDSLEVLTGDNNAVMVCVNFVPGSVFMKDLFNSLTGNRVQVANYDFWRSRQVATDMALGRSGQVDLGSLRDFLHARVGYTVATLATMFDGTQRLIERVPNDFHTARSL